MTKEHASKFNFESCNIESDVPECTLRFVTVNAAKNAIVVSVHPRQGNNLAQREISSSAGIEPQRCSCTTICKEAILPLCQTDMVAIRLLLYFCFTSPLPRPHRSFFNPILNPSPSSHFQCTLLDGDR